MIKFVAIVFAFFLLYSEGALAEEYLVKYKKGARPSADVVQSYRTLPGIHLLKLSDREKSRLENSDQIEYVEKNYTRQISTTPNDPFFDLLWGLENTGQEIKVGSSSFFGTPGSDIRAPLAWNTRTDATDVPLAIIDSGIQLNHPDLVDNLWTNPGEIPGNGLDDDANGYTDDVHGWDFVNNDNNPTDDNGHGTHVAGTAGARGDNSVGVAGVAWRASLVALKACNAQGSCPDNAIIAAIDYCRKMKIPISNNSYGGPGASLALEEALRLAMNTGHLFVAAAGNESQNNDGADYYPGNYPLANIVSVAASRENDAKASFSNYGRASVDIAAPGVNILSTVPGGGYAWESGTSMSTPIVSGAAALVLAQNPTWSYDKTSEALLASARKSGSWASLSQSEGILNLEAALNYTPGKSKARILSTPSTSTEDTSAVFLFTGETGASFSCKLNNNAWEPCSSPKQYVSLSPGTYTFSVRQEIGGEIDADVASFIWTVVSKTTSSAVSIESTPRKYSKKKKARFIFSSTKQAQCRLDREPWETCSSPKRYGDLDEGVHYFRVREGEVGVVSKYKWTVDTQGPRVIGSRILSQQGKAYRVRISAKDAITRVEEVEFSGKSSRPSKNRSPLLATNWSKRVTIVRNRPPRWVRVSDRLGNWSAWEKVSS